MIIYYWDGPQGWEWAISGMQAHPQAHTTRRKMLWAINQTEHRALPRKRIDVPMCTGFRSTDNPLNL